MMRVVKRLIIRYFGGIRNFLIWLIGVIVTIYILDSYIFTDERTGYTNAHSLKTPSKTNVAHMDQGRADLPAAAAQPPQNEPSAKAGDKDEKSSKANALRAKKKSGPFCGMKTACPADQFAYSIRTGEGNEKGKQPVICFEDYYAMDSSKKNGGRGINIVVIDDQTFQVVDARAFDTYTEDGALVRYLKLGIKDHHIIIAASWDEIFTGLKDDGKKWLQNYGSGLIDKVKFRDSWMMVGQRGLKTKALVEKHGDRGSKAFADPIYMEGCFSIPLGQVGKLDVKKSNVEDGSSMKVGEELPNCGVKDACGSDSFPVHLYTGKGNSEGPKICVSGKYVLAKGLNDGGRGLNLVVVDPVTKDVIRVGHFDTYAEDSSNLEIFLELMGDKEIVMAVAHDDASKKLSDHAKQLFNMVGSGMIQNVKFRDAWVFIGQVGIDGFGELEQLEKQPKRGYPIPIDKRMCVPTKLKGSKIKPDPLANKNDKRREFCAKYDGYGDFCDAEHIDENLTPAPLTDKSLENHAIFRIPIIVIPGLSHNAVRMQLETLLMQPGLKPELVTVMFDEKFDESAHLAELFKYKTSKLGSSTKYAFQVEKALDQVWILYPEADHVIVLEEEVILAQDFLSFLAQCLAVLDKDDSLIGVSAWNENGYKGLSDDGTLAYRVETFPGLGFLLKKSFYNSHMKGKMQECCNNRSWDGWLVGKLSGYEMIIPDVSRVYRRPYEGLSGQADFLTELFNRPRVTNLDPAAKIREVDSLTSVEYDTYINMLLQSATGLDTVNVEDCLQGKGLGFYIPKTTGKTYVIYFEQQDVTDTDILRRLTKCFELFNADGYAPRGLHKGILRFTTKGNAIIFVGSSSPFYKNKPSSYTPVQRSKL